MLGASVWAQGPPRFVLGASVWAEEPPPRTKTTTPLHHADMNMRNDTAVVENVEAYVYNSGPLQARLLPGLESFLQLPKPLSVQSYELRFIIKHSSYPGIETLVLA